MSFQTEKLGSHMAAAVSRLDLNRLPDAATRSALLDVLHGNLVLCIRAQTLMPPAYRSPAQFEAWHRATRLPGVGDAALDKGSAPPTPDPPLDHKPEQAQAMD